MADQDPPTRVTGSPSGSADGPRIERDLRAIREARGVDIDTVQRDTRMPGDILRRFEAGELVSDPHYNEVYLRNLLKAYAQALGLSPQEVIKGYEQAKSGSYDGGLRRQYLSESAAPSKPSPEPPPAPEEKRPKPPASAKGTAPAVAALSSPPPKPEKRAERPAAPVSEPKRRVQTVGAAGTKPIQKSWGLIIGGTLAAVLVIGAVLWFLLRDDGPELERVAQPAPADTARVATAPADTAAVPAATPVPSSAPSFQTPIQLTVVAGENPLEGYRVQVDDDARKPYWVEPGQTQSFTAQQRIAVWGELEQGGSGGGSYDGSRLRLQGVEWMPRDGQVFRINGARGQAVLDSLSRVRSGPTG